MFQTIQMLLEVESKGAKILITKEGQDYINNELNGLQIKVEIDEEQQLKHG